MKFYPYIDPFNTTYYAKLRRLIGYRILEYGETKLYVKDTILGRVGQAFFPTEQINPKNLDFLKLLGLPEPSREADTTTFTYTIHINLQQPINQMLASFQKNKRWGIRKAEERGAQAFFSESKQDFEEFWNIYKATVKRKRIHRISKAGLERFFKEKEFCKLLLVKAEHRTIGAYLVLHSHEVARFFYGGFLHEYRRFHPNELAHYTLVKHFHGENFKIYDMGGAGQNPRKGDFKFGWGAPVKLYSCIFAKSKLLASLINKYYITKLWLMRIKGQLT